MNKSKWRALLTCLPLSVGFSLAAVACGGSSDDAPKNNGGTSGTTAGSGGSDSGSEGGGESSDGGTPSNGGAPSNAGTSSSGGKGGTGTSSGGSAGSGGDFSTGLPDDQPLSDLNDEEFEQLCSAIGDHFDPILADFNCRLNSLIAAAFSSPDTDADAQAACKAAYDSCTPEPAGETCSRPTGTCTATVGELEACANDTDAVLSQVREVFPDCAELTLQDLMDAGGAMEPAEPASCQALDAKCPDAPGPATPTP